MKATARLSRSTRSTPPPLRVGLFGIGLDASWPQLKGLKPRLERYVREAAARLQRPGVEGPAHHCAVGVGHIAHKIEKPGALLGMKAQRVC